MEERCEPVDSRWDLSGMARTTSCGLSELARSASLRQSLRRSREPYWIVSKSASQLLAYANCLSVCVLLVPFPLLDFFPAHTSGFAYGMIGRISTVDIGSQNITTRLGSCKLCALLAPSPPPATGP